MVAATFPLQRYSHVTHLAWFGASLVMSSAGHVVGRQSRSCDGGADAAGRRGVRIAGGHQGVDSAPLRVVEGAPA